MLPERLENLLNEIKPKLQGDFGKIVISVNTVYSKLSKKQILNHLGNPPGIAISISVVEIEPDWVSHVSKYAWTIEIFQK